MAKTTVPPDDVEQPDETPGADDTAQMTPEEIREELRKAKEALKAKEDHVRKLNEENARRRKDLEAIEKEREAKESEKLTDIEKARKEAAAARREAEESRALLQKTQDDHRHHRIRAEIERHAQKAGIPTPEIAPDIILGQGIGDVTVAEDGAVEGAKEAVERLLKRYPALIGAGSRPGTPQRRDEGRRPENGAEAMAARKARQEKVNPYEEELNNLGLGGRM